MYRHHPQTALARRLVADGAIGRLATVRAALSVSVPAGDIRRSVELAVAPGRPRLLPGFGGRARAFGAGMDRVVGSGCCSM